MSAYGPRPTTSDVLVIGSGAGGLAAAVAAAHFGARVTVLEKEPVLGGTTAWSGGWIWAPRNPLAQEAGIIEAAEVPRAYLRAALDWSADAERLEAFLAAAPEMVAFFRDHTALQFIGGDAIADMYGDLPGAGTGGRSVCAAPFDGRELGKYLELLRRPLAETAFWGMGIASGADLGHFMAAARRWRSAAYVARRLQRHIRDVVFHGRGQRLVNGNALVARLLKSALDLGVTVLPGHRVTQLLLEGDRVSGVSYICPNARTGRLYARRGVVLACGGFPWDEALRQALFPHTPSGAEHWSVAPDGNTGDGIRMAREIGARFRDDQSAPGAWVPVSMVRRRDGSHHPFPHFIDRAKPGLIAVRADGKRFVNEADGYHDVLRMLLETTPHGEQPEAWLICDHRFIRRYGLGHARPAPVPLGRHLRDGYLQRGATIAELAQVCGIDPDGLSETLGGYNPAAREGHDPAFRRGESPFNRAGGDPEQRPNPCVAPLETPPFYAVRVVPGSMGTFSGLLTDALARVLCKDGSPMKGLHAAGTDMASIFGGAYPAGGINLGPAMTFGFVAGRHLGRMPQ